MKKFLSFLIVLSFTFVLFSFEDIYALDINDKPLIFINARHYMNISEDSYFEYSGFDNGSGTLYDFYGGSMNPYGQKGTFESIIDYSNYYILFVNAYRDKNGYSYVSGLGLQIVGVGEPENTNPLLSYLIFENVYGLYRAYGYNAQHEQISITNTYYELEWLVHEEQYLALDFGVNDSRLNVSPDISAIREKAYKDGYYDGYFTGEKEGYLLGKQEGLDLGYDLGFKDGFDEGVQNAGTDYVGVFSIIANGIFAPIILLFNLEILPHITLGMIILVPLIFGLIAFIIGGKKND